MEDFRLLNVGVIKFDNLEQYYQVMMESENGKFRLELNFKDKIIEEPKKVVLKNFKDNLKNFENYNQLLLENDFAKHGVVESYIDFCFSKTLIGLAETIVKQRSTDVLKLVRVAIYPDGNYEEDCYATFNYTINEIFNCPVLIVKTDEFGSCKYLSWES